MTKKTRGPNVSYAQGCPIALGLDAVGDRWTLLLLRDLAHARLRFRDLQAINPRLSPNLLVKRLRDLERTGLVVRRKLPPPASATVYALTDEAREAVLPILTALGRFGASLGDRMPSGSVGPLVEQLRRNATWVLAKGIDFTGEFVVQFGAHRVGINVGPATFEPSTTLPENPTATLVLTPSTMPLLANGGMTISRAEDEGALRITGDRGAAIALLEKLSLAELER